jgi:hypothetical protein
MGIVENEEVYGGGWWWGGSIKWFGTLQEAVF